VGWTLPKGIGLTPFYQYLEVCATFGQDPMTYQDRLTGWWAQQLAAYVDVRARIRGGGGGGG